MKPTLHDETNKIMNDTLCATFVELLLTRTRSTGSSGQAAMATRHFVFTLLRLHVDAFVCRLRDDERKDPDVIEHIKAENAHTAAVMADMEDLQVSWSRLHRG